MTATPHDRIVHVDDDSYEAAVGDSLVLLDFRAEPCGPCKALEPVVEELVDGYPGSPSRRSMPARARRRWRRSASGPSRR